MSTSPTGDLTVSTARHQSDPIFLDDSTRDNLADGQRADRRHRHVQLREPARHLSG